MRKRKKFFVGEIEVKSNLEKLIGEQLLQRSSGFIYEKESYKWKEKLPRAICGECETKGKCFVERSYKPDFFLSNGIILEVKGRFTSKDRKIAAAMKEQHPELDIRMVFSKNNWITRQHKTNYGQWCDSKGILWTVNDIPEEWLR